METTNKIVFLVLKSCRPFRFLFSFVDFPSQLKIYQKYVSKINFYLFLLTKLLLENAIITKTPFLGATCVAGLEMGGKIFLKIQLMTPSPGILLARKKHGPSYPAFMSILPLDSIHLPASSFIFKALFVLHKANCHTLKIRFFYS